MITVRKSQNGALTQNLMIQLKRFIFAIWLIKRGGTFPRPFSGKINFLKIKHLKKTHFFLVSEYGNSTCVKTHRDRLRSSGEGFLERGVQIFVLERVKDLIKDSDAVWSLPFILLFAPSMSLRKFLFLLQTALSGFHPRVIFSFHFHFSSFLLFFDCPIMHLTIQNSSRTSERLIKIFCWLRKRDNSLVDYKKFLKEENSPVQVSTFNQNGLSGM